MKRDTFTHDDTFLVFNSKDAGSCGDIDFWLVYRVTNWGRPEQGPSYASGGEPAEGPEIEVVSVQMMLPIPSRGEGAVYVDAFPWLAEWVSNWAQETIDELVELAGDELEGQREANEEAKYEAERGNCK